MDYGLSTIERRLLKILFVTLTSAFALTGCHHDVNTAKPPEQLLSQQQMVSFLIDLHLAEAKMNYVNVRQSDSTEILFRNYEKHLMNQHGFTDSVYLKSYAYYLDHMELMNEIYEDVVDSLSVMSTLEKAKQDEQSEESP